MVPRICDTAFVWPLQRNCFPFTRQLFAKTVARGPLLDLYTK